jgi:hypothetical protein
MIEFAGSMSIAALGQRGLTDRQPDALPLDSLDQPQLCQCTGEKQRDMF